jgi:hypothetical protein
MQKYARQVVLCLGRDLIEKDYGMGVLGAFEGIKDGFHYTIPLFDL